VRGRFVLFLMAVSLLTVLPAARARAAGEDPIAEAAAANRRCLTCHPGEPFATTYQESNHKALACVACHASVHGQPAGSVRAEAAAPTQGGIALTREWSLGIDRTCRTCHEDADRALAGSAHGTVAAGSHTAVQCADCHGSHAIFKASDPRAAVSRRNVATTCGRCHDPKIAEAYRYSFHGSAVKLGSRRAATCVDCHGGHDILPQVSPASSVNEANLPGTCARCHVKPRANFARGPEHTTIHQRSTGFPLWVTWKIFLAIILLDVTQNAVLITLELLRQWRDASHTAAVVGRESHD